MLAKNLQGAAAAAVPAYIEDTFSTYLYAGNDSTQTITNGIDLSGKGGLVWIKMRNGATDHVLFDTSRGVGKGLFSNSADAQLSSGTNGISQFNSNGFNLNNLVFSVNDSGRNYASWTFREQAKFFDVVTYTGNGVAGRTVTHNLGSVPGCIIVKRLDNAENWPVYHRSAGGDIFLNTTAASIGSYLRIYNPTTTNFQVNSATNVNANGGTYVAYLFAHDAGGFGASGSDNVVSCGSFTTDGSTGFATITLGYEPQFVIYKRTDGVGDWEILDTGRGWTVDGQVDYYLQANTSSAEGFTNLGAPTATGFFMALAVARSYIYIAIRRGPMKTPTSGTQVFTPVTRTGTGANTTTVAGFPVDMGMTGNRGAVASKFGTVDRLRGAPYLITSATAAEVTDATVYQANPFDTQTALKIGTTSAITNASGNTYVDHLFRRAPGFFDVVCYTGTGVTNRTVNHNLGVAPELMILKSRSDGFQFWVTGSNFTSTTFSYGILNNPNAITLNRLYSSGPIAANPSSTQFTLSNSFLVNGSTVTYVAYLFATVPGVSKVGSYTGNGSNQTINCGFTGGARFILIKRTDASGDWYVWDTARGIVSGNDPRLSLNSSGAEVTTDDSVDTDSSGFIVNQLSATNINVNAATYIFLAIA